jgi:hypothetical protein
LQAGANINDLIAVFDGLRRSGERQSYVGMVVGFLAGQMR